MDLEEARERNEHLERRLIALERELELAKQERKREELKRLNERTKELEHQIALREAALAEYQANKPIKLTGRNKNQEDSRQPIEEPKPSTSKYKESWETTDVKHEDKQINIEDKENQAPKWQRTINPESQPWETPPQIKTRIVWNEVYSSSSSKTPSSEKKHESQTNNKLKAKPVIKLNRLEEVDPTLILNSRTRTRTSIDFRSQFDIRKKEKIRHDEQITRWIGKETRLGGHHHRKALTKAKVQETWRYKAQGVPPGEATLLRLEKEHRRKAITTAKQKTGFGRLFKILSDSDIEDAGADEPAPVLAANPPAGGRVRQKAATSAATATTIKVAAVGSKMQENGKRTVHRQRSDDELKHLPRIVSVGTMRESTWAETGAEAGDVEDKLTPPTLNPSGRRRKTTRPSEPVIDLTRRFKLARNPTRPSESVIDLTRQSEPATSAEE
ncbi:uncharacterized protein LOC116840877 [Odontomachus brunneus]|uniref:uncharacterized protein LOC116840877 n=1 Tax=Odontomachus brunneus TaxID=486640 RepID=UPI0013F254E1|nr:uncharacterized protein LOC116840877 [Odontomachus brunneus]